MSPVWAPGDAARVVFLLRTPSALTLQPPLHEETRIPCYNKQALDSLPALLGHFLSPRTPSPAPTPQWPDRLLFPKQLRSSMPPSLCPQWFLSLKCLPYVSLLEFSKDTSSRKLSRSPPAIPWPFFAHQIWCQRHRTSPVLPDGEAHGEQCAHSHSSRGSVHLERGARPSPQHRRGAGCVQQGLHSWLRMPASLVLAPSRSHRVQPATRCPSIPGTSWTHALVFRAEHKKHPHHTFPVACVPENAMRTLLKVELSMQEILRRSGLQTPGEFFRPPTLGPPQCLSPRSLQGKLLFQWGACLMSLLWRASPGAWAGPVGYSRSPVPHISVVVLLDFSSIIYSLTCPPLPGEGGTPERDSDFPLNLLPPCLEPVGTQETPRHFRCYLEA